MFDESGPSALLRGHLQGLVHQSNKYPKCSCFVPSPVLLFLQLVLSLIHFFYSTRLILLNLCLHLSFTA